MHLESEKNYNLFPYRRKGKIYNYEYDWDKEFELETQDIKNAAKEKILEKENALFQDEKFVEFCEKVMTDENGLQEYFDSNSDLYKSNFRLLLLKHGCFEFADEKILQNATPEQRESFYNDMFFQMNMIHSAIVSENIKSGQKLRKSEPTYLEKIYLNFLENFAPQMVSLATASRPVKRDFLLWMDALKKLTLDKYAVPNLYDQISIFNEEYSLDTIIKILNTYDKIKPENDERLNEKYKKQIDILCSNGIEFWGNNKGILNLANEDCVETAGQLIDIIPSRLVALNMEERLMSEDIDFIVSVIDKIQSTKLPQTYMLNIPIITKAMQLVDLKILSEKENQKIIDALDRALNKSELRTPDMGEYDEKISKRIPFDKMTAVGFLFACKILTIKEGIMPAKYNEYLIACMLDEKSEISKRLSDDDRRMILENYARRRAKQMLEKPVYVTYTKNFSSNEKVLGRHSFGIIQLVPNYHDDPVIGTALSITSINHELRHEWQHQNKGNYKSNRLVYAMQKDEMLMQLLDKGFYNRNYARLYAEIDAEYFALRHTRNFLQTLNLTDFKKSSKYKSVEKVLNKKIKEQEERFSFSDRVIFENGKYMKMDDFFDLLLKKNPQYLEKYPFLKIEYNEDGSKKEDVDFTPKLLDFDE